MRSTRAQYHSAVKWVKQNDKYIRNIRLAESVAANKTKCFWKEIRKVKCKKKSIAGNIDGIYGDKEIANHFADKFSSLYNSVSYDNDDISSCFKEIDSDIVKYCSRGFCDKNMNAINVHDVTVALRTLNTGKKDGTLNLYTDHLIRGTSRLWVLLSLLFSSMCIHGFSPSDIIGSTMIPLPKMKGTVNSENFRAITLSNVILKHFEVIVLNKYQSNLLTSDMQFGFKKNSSTTSCTFVVQEVISYFNNSNSDVIVTMLDASKAFDRIHFPTLFNKLRHRKICPIVLRLLLYMYTNQQVRVRWNGTVSHDFMATNGIKQGGILSPLFFCIYIELLLLELKKSGMGCFVGNNFYGALGYADDIVLLSPSIVGMKRMLKVCETYANLHFIQFNAKKSHAIIFKAKCVSTLRTYSNLYINNQCIQYVDSAKHLGHLLDNSVESILDVNYISGIFTKSVNILMADLGSVPSGILIKLFSQYCCSLYGIGLCDIRSNEVNKLNIQWRKALRRIFKLPF